MKNTQKRGVGRPKANVNVPKGKFTFKMLKAANEQWEVLTLRNFLARDKKRRNMSLVMVLDEVIVPKNGMGRPEMVYMLRKAKRNTLKKASKSNVSVNIAESAAAILGAPAPVVPDAPVTPPVAEPAVV